MLQRFLDPDTLASISGLDLVVFNVPILKNGLKRIVNRYQGSTHGVFDSHSGISPRLRASASKEAPVLTEAS